MGALDLVEGSYKYLYVNAKREAVVQLAVFGENQQRQGVRAIIDTRYTDFLTLPSTMITALGLTWYMQQAGILGDGSLCMFNVYFDLVSSFV